MKRQHPTDPNLFWCQKCQTYKAREEFVKRSDRPIGITAKCKRCHADYARDIYKKDPEKAMSKSREYCKNHPAICKLLKRRYIEKHRNSETFIAKRKRAKLRQVVEIRDSYLISNMKRDGIPITPETIELKRQQVIAKRTLKQLKEWRKEHESDRDVISGKQRKDEAVNEINRGREETGYGGDSGLPAGM